MVAGSAGSVQLIAQTPSRCPTLGRDPMGVWGKNPPRLPGVTAQAGPGPAWKTDALPAGTEVRLLTIFLAKILVCNRAGNAL